MKNKTTIGDTFTICKEQEEKELKKDMMVEVATSGRFVGYSDFIWFCVASYFGKQYKDHDIGKIIIKRKQEMTTGGIRKE